MIDINPKVLADSFAPDRNAMACQLPLNGSTERFIRGQ
jgi:hypothetical protein